MIRKTGTQCLQIIKKLPKSLPVGFYSTVQEASQIARLLFLSASFYEPEPYCSTMRVRGELPSQIQCIADDSFCLYGMSWCNACAASTIVPLLEYGVATMGWLHKVLRSLLVERTGMIRLFYKKNMIFFELSNRCHSIDLWQSVLLPT